MARATDSSRTLRDRLAARGLDVERPLEALAGLEARWGEEPELEAEVVELLGASDEPAAGERLSALTSRTTNKNVKRAIKRALYRLEQRGLWRAPEAPPPPPASALLGPSEDEPEAWATAIDPSGSRLVWMARRTAQGMASLSAVVNDVQGLLEFYAGATTRKMLRQTQRDLSERSGVALIEIPWQHADALLMRALERATDRSRDAEVRRARDEIVPHPPASPPPPPVDALLDRAAAAADPNALKESLAALREKELGGWLLPRDWVEPALTRIEDAQTSVLVISPQQREERLRAELERATQEVLDDAERRALFAERLDESAYLLARRGRMDLARALVAAAEAARAGRPIAEIPVLAEIARRSLVLALEIKAQRAQEQAQSSLIVTPAQALAEQQRLRGR
ncbi:MAG TPA: hypothetical protein VIS07_02920 [Candidatus Binatia bacterium]